MRWIVWASIILVALLAGLVQCAHPVDEAVVLQWLETATGFPPDWTKTNSSSICQWSAITCTTQQRIKSIVFPLAISLNGTFVESMASLTDLTTLRIEGPGTLQGQVSLLPFWHMPKLEMLVIDNQLLTGTMPTSITSPLTSLRLKRNWISGSLPATLVGLTGLNELNIAENNLECPVPAGLLEKVANVTAAYTDVRGNRLFVDPASGRVCGNGPRVQDIASLPVIPQFNDSIALEPNLWTLTNEYIQVGVSKYRVSFFGMNEDGATELEEYYSIIVHGYAARTEMNTQVQQETFLGFHGAHAPPGGNRWELYSSFSDGTKLDWLLDFDAIEGVKFSLVISNWVKPSSLQTGKWVLQYQNSIKFQHTESAAMPCYREFLGDQIGAGIFDGAASFKTNVWSCNSPYASTNATMIIDLLNDDFAIYFLTRGRKLQFTFRWPLNLLKVDGANTFLTSGASPMYLWPYGTDKYITDLLNTGLWDPTTPVAPNQFWASLHSYYFPLFEKSIEYDPDINIVSLFTLNDANNETPVAAIAGPVVGAVAVLAVVAGGIWYWRRRRMFRSDVQRLSSLSADAPASTSTLSSSPDNSPENAQRGTWQTGKRPSNTAV